MIILPALGFPISPFYIFAGAVFNPWLIIPVGLVALSINMSVSYALARHVWREPLQKKFAARWPKLFAIDEISAARITILVRAVPGVPFPVQNCLLGVLAVPFWTYIALSVLIQGCFLTGVVLTTQGALNQNGQTALWGGLIIGITLLSLHLFYKQRTMRT
ncbi:hypothetical protein GCM10007047_01910 [Cerasicoccus arenae]|uniref:TVP38/TMEM64 family membrane protein n=2 Tax=Cerasicoccus arenae TaxID=424488 RepID=A0A8J3GDD2_9BACT|nr:hypothetical protein GCM10007047_01910 [Cerasicoccus arenae]